ncbi:hypothetical protein M0R89_07670 [Halorussus limi]|uniref:Uncharacterized protein n=1 Tax=Halorussus limi TaxID=2938695 RepID=A0A8U0HYC7_9EURY|nr:hypothetical protein [Halorussus limi]UPV75927.1 hypothetical protein M0R89_07670 [Halorussus limi]
MSDLSELGVSVPVAGIAAAALGVAGLELGGLTTRLLGGAVPVHVALAGGALAALAGGAVGFWFGSVRPDAPDD